MENLSVGIDILEIERMKQAVGKYGERFLKKVFTEEEREKMPAKNSPLYYALGFSFKEAVWKALPEKTQEVTSFKDVEVFWEKRKPTLKMKNLSPDYWLSFSQAEEFVVTLALLGWKEVR